MRAAALAFICACLRRKNSLAAALGTSLLHAPALLLLLLWVEGGWGSEARQVRRALPELPTLTTLPPLLPPPADAR